MDIDIKDILCVSGMNDISVSGISHPSQSKQIISDRVIGPTSP
jgi:hypothetical protein